MDKHILLVFYNFSQKNTVFGSVMNIFYKYSSTAFFLIYYAGAMYLIFANTSRLAFYIGTLFLTFAANQTIRQLVKRTRPPTCPDNIKKGFSFPSNHSAMASTIAFSMLSLDMALGAAVFFFAALTCVSRVAKGVHYPSDVLAGFAIGVLFAVLGFGVIPAIVG